MGKVGYEEGSESEHADVKLLICHWAGENKIQVRLVWIFVNGCDRFTVLCGD